MAVVKPIDSVTTFVAEIEKPPLAEVVAKFAGKHTLRTLAAARRIRAKKERVKIPRNLLRQLWRGTGGWYEKGLQSGWPSSVPSSAKKIQLGELVVLTWESHGYPGAALEFRGRQVANLPAAHSVWRDEKMAKGFSSLGL